jgi:hypothetical protein
MKPNGPKPSSKVIRQVQEEINKYSNDQNLTQQQRGAYNRAQQSINRARSGNENG